MYNINNCHNQVPLAVWNKVLDYISLMMVASHGKRYSYDKIAVSDCI